MKNPILLLAAVALCGCATVTNVPVTGLDRSDKVAVSDLRPKIESEGETFSLLITSDAYALYRVADAAIAPPSVRLLKHRAYERFGTAGAMAEMKVRHLVTYRNMQAELRRSAIGAGIGGIIGAVVAGAGVAGPGGSLSYVIDAAKFDAVGPEEFKRALYTEAENPGKGSLHIVFIETEMNGKRVFTRTVAPTKVKEGEQPLAVALEAAIAFHLTQY